MFTLPNNNLKYIYLGVLAVIIGVFSFGVSIEYINAQTSADVDDRRAQLEEELLELETQIKTQRNLVEGKQKEGASLKSSIAILDAQIKKKKLEIQARNIAISNLGIEIQEKNNTITSLDDKINREQQVLAQLLRRTRELDDASLFTVLLANQSLSDFFADLDQFEAIQFGLFESFREIRDTKESTNKEKLTLKDRQYQERELRSFQSQEKSQIEAKETEKERLLAVTKGEEAAYQKILTSQEKTAAQIRSELFQLRGTKAIPFGEALDLANFVSAKTGVRPAFILGVIAEESNLGENVGTGNWKDDMHPDRDVYVFRAIADTLGFNPDAQPVSKKPWYGWGGAMGPAQFIPTTWACFGGYVNTSIGKCGRNSDKTWVGPWAYDASKDRIRITLGKNSPSNPWEPRDAFMANALLLKENGADKGTLVAERLAALRYFAGWANAKKSSYAFYGDDVMSLAAKYQKQIDILGGN